MIARLAMPAAEYAAAAERAAQDGNGNGRIEQSEAQGNLQAQFALYDQDRDGALSGAEVTRGPLAFVRPPDLTYRDPLTITLGGKRVEVLPRPTAHADDNTIVRFVDGTGVLFASDWITVKRVPFGGDVATKAGAGPGETVEALEFEHFVCSHGMLGKKADVLANIRYREELREAVAKVGRGRPDARAGASQRDDGRVQGLGVLRAAASGECGRHVPRADERSMSAPSNPIRGLDHVAVPMQNTAAMLAFYRGLGLDVTETPRAYSVHIGSQMINFHRPEIWQDPAYTLRAPGTKPPSGDFCVVWEGQRSGSRGVARARRRAHRRRARSSGAARARVTGVEHLHARP